jgi:hypothetical protein
MTKGALEKTTWLLVVGLVAFVALEAIAIALWPGGSWRDPTAARYSFVDNYFCDLTSNVTIRGEPNPGAPFGRAALVAFAVALLPFWWRSSWLPKRRGLGVAILSAGSASAIVAMAVPFTPTSKYGAWHGVVTMVAGGLGLFAAILALAAAIERRATAIWATGLSAFASGAAVSIIYGRSLLTHVDPFGLAAAQKLAALCLMTWMALTAMRRAEGFRENASSAATSP